MRAVRVRSRHLNGRHPNGLKEIISVIRLRDKSSSGWGLGGGGGGGGAYARDKNTSAGLYAKNAGGGGGLMREGRAYLRDTTVQGMVLASSPGHFLPPTWPRSEVNTPDLAAYAMHQSYRYVCLVGSYQIATK